MAEYIDREASLVAIAEEEKDYDFDIRDVLSGLYIAESAVEAVPAADMEPVRHGRWVQTRITRYNGDMIWFTWQRYSAKNTRRICRSR